MNPVSAARLAELRRDRDRTRAQLIELELEIAALVSRDLTDIRSEIAEAEERGDWLEAARLRASCIHGTSGR